jgi:hypothetical protein
MSVDIDEDWTDAKHGERVTRDRVLGDGVLVALLMKSDYEGFKRLVTNLCVLMLTAGCIARLKVLQMLQKQETAPSSAAVMIFIPLYLLFGFQLQCFAFAGQHEFLHRNAFKTRWINDWCLFVTGVVCFEFGEHERGMALSSAIFYGLFPNSLCVRVICGVCSINSLIQSCTSSITYIQTTLNEIPN